MTTNRERAADFIADATIPPGTSIAWGMDRAVLAAEILDESGLLMPDLPEPEVVEEEDPYWYSSTYGFSVRQLAGGSTKKVLFWDSEPGGVAYLSAEEARELAYTLLAAAAHTNKGREL